MTQIKDFISSLRIRPELQRLLAADKIVKKHSFYLQLCKLLAPAFPKIDEEILNRLIGYSYLYFRFTLEVDQLLDCQHNSIIYAKQLFACLGIHEQAIRGLMQLFPAENEFWESFDSCKNAFIDANMREKELSKREKVYSKQTFEDIASGKSAICYAMVHALSNLSNSNNHIVDLLDCLQQMHIALQYLDDLEDFKQDCQEKQFTYAQQLVSDYLDEQQIRVDRTSADTLYRYLYSSGIAYSMLDQTKYHLELSLNIAKNLGLVEFAINIQQHINRCKNHQWEITQLLQKTKIKATKSFTLMHSGTQELTVVSLRYAINSAVKHLANSRDASGCWSDFLTSAGQSKLWATAYAGLLLAETSEGFHLAYEAYNAAFNLPASYNENIMQDGDSTNCFMGLRQKVWGETNKQQLDSWLAFTDSDGGWVTYRNADQLQQIMSLPSDSNVTHWLTAKPCVTAVATYVLALYGELEPEYRTSCNYLVQNQHVDGHWDSYWWSSDIYATAFASLALGSLQEYAAYKSTALHWIASRQAADGAWYDDNQESLPSAFFTALAVKSLLGCPENSYSSAILRGITWLLNNQTHDGSWLPTRILRIPAPDIEDCSIVNKWRLSSFGVNIVVDDHNRVFTTSTAINALSLFTKQFCGNLLS